MMCNLAGVIAYPSYGLVQTMLQGIIGEESELALALEMSEDLQRLDPCAANGL